MELAYRAWITGLLVAFSGSPVAATGLLDLTPDAGLPVQVPAFRGSVARVSRLVWPSGTSLRPGRCRCGAMVPGTTGSPEGVLDRLRAKALVIQAGPSKLAIVGMDLGRGPTPAMMERIRAGVAPRGHRPRPGLRQPHASRPGDRADRSTRLRQGQVR